MAYLGDDSHGHMDGERIMLKASLSPRESDILDRCVHDVLVLVLVLLLTA